MNIDNSNSHGDLSDWSAQGVLLLNNVLTVEEGKPNSHKNKGWEEFTSNVFDFLNKREDPVVFVLWGGFAQKKEKQINKHHVVLKTPHPSPLSAYRGFFGSNIFLDINQELMNINKKAIDWRIK